MEPNTETAGPLHSYLMVADTLRGLIENGTYGPRSQLPTQEALVRRFKVSRSTVQRALKELTDGGYIDSQRGRGAYVRSGRSDAAGVDALPAFGSTSEMLSARVRAAFEAEQVVIDAYSLSAETLVQAIAPQVIRIQLGEIRPQSITVRALLADHRTDHLVGESATSPNDPRPRQRIANLLQRHSANLAGCFDVLIDDDAVPQVSVAIQTTSATPVMKAYLLNEAELLQGYYMYAERTLTGKNGEPPLIFNDALGARSTLFAFTIAQNDPVSVAFVEQARTWFESLWQTTAKTSRVDG